MQKSKRLLVLTALATWVGSGLHAPPDAVAQPELEPRKPGLPEFRIYNGQPPKRVVGRSEIRGARGHITLEPVLQGDVVQHEVLITNDSEAPWALSNLRMCSGCMLDGVTKTIGPGESGAIGFVIPTDALGGQIVDGTIRATTGASAPATIEIGIHLEVREFAALHPYRLWLQGTAGDSIEETVIVVPNDAYPFSIREILTRKGVWIETAVRETEHEGRRAFAIDVRNTRNKPGPYQDVLFVQTDHPERPEFRIRVEGRIE